VLPGRRRLVLEDVQGDGRDAQGSNGPPVPKKALGLLKV
jgi:hypothetical protein